MTQTQHVLAAHIRTRDACYVIFKGISTCAKLADNMRTCAYLLFLGFAQLSGCRGSVGCATEGCMRVLTPTMDLHR